MPGCTLEGRFSGHPLPPLARVSLGFGSNSLTYQRGGSAPIAMPSLGTTELQAWGACGFLHPFKHALPFGLRVHRAGWLPLSHHIVVGLGGLVRRGIPLGLGHGQDPSITCMFVPLVGQSREVLEAHPAEIEIDAHERLGAFTTGLGVPRAPAVLAVIYFLNFVVIMAADHKLVVTSSFES